MDTASTTKPVEELQSVVIRFAGDSGDGMQLTGTQFTNTTALAGNDLSTLPDFPAEIRAPAGTRAGVSGFQLHFASDEIFTPGDAPNVLVAMNPAALVTNIGRLEAGGTVIVNTDKFKARDLQTADLEVNPLEDGTLDEYHVIPVPLSSLTKGAVEGLGLKTKEADRCKNFFALGMTYWMFNRDMSHTQAWIEGKFKDPYKEANLRCLQAGWNFADTMELLDRSYKVPPAALQPGTYRNIMGNQATALGVAAAATLAQKQVLFASYPITPASDILHQVSHYKHYGVATLQAEDEIAAACAAIGASFGGNIGFTSTSGPGLALKGEALGLAMITELPLVVINVQRGGPSTGLPTKTEQSDLNIAMYGRNGESPLPIIAAQTPSDCFMAVIEATRIAVKYMVPVLVLTDGYLANGSEPWKLPELADLKPIEVTQVTENNNPEGAFHAYKRDPDTLARPWAVPGTPGLEHRIGGLEKQDLTGNVSYDPANHEFMCRIRQEKVERIVADVPDQEVFGTSDGLLVVSWGSTYGAVRQAVRGARLEGKHVAHAHLRWLNPFPANLAALFEQYDRILVPEMNLGQLAGVLRSTYLVELESFTKIQGQPFTVTDLKTKIDQLTEA